MPKQRLPPIAEREILKNARLYLESIRWEVRRRNVAKFVIKKPGGKRRFFRAADPGQSDLYGKMPSGRRFELEIKSLGREPTKKQLYWLLSQNDEHCVAFWVDNLDTLERIAPAIAGGMRVVYGDGCDYDLVKPRGRRRE